MTATDVLNTQQALGSRWSKRAAWVSSLTYQNRVRAFGTNYWGQSSEFNQAVSPAILGRASYEASDMSTALNTVTNPALVYGDFTNYVIVDRIGSRVSYIPHLFGASGRPAGLAGWHLYRRVGAELGQVAGQRGTRQRLGEVRCAAAERAFRCRAVRNGYFRPGFEEGSRQPGGCENGQYCEEEPAEGYAQAERRGRARRAADRAGC